MGKLWSNAPLWDRLNHKMLPLECVVFPGSFSVKSLTEPEHQGF